MIRAVERALSIFEQFDRKTNKLTLQDISIRTRLSKATVFRLVNTLHNAGYLVRLDDGNYCLSLKFTALSGAVHSTLGVRDIARPTMKELVKKAGETITLNMLDNHQRLCIEVVESPSPLMSIVHTGERAPLVVGATGKILAAYLDGEELAMAIAMTPEAMRPSRKKLEEDLARYRKQGYACTTGERVRGVTAISVPIRGLSEKVIYSLSLTGPSIRVDDMVNTFVELMVSAGNTVSSQMGNLDPRP